jgi:squalene synthase HpnC
MSSPMGKVRRSSGPIHRSCPSTKSLTPIEQRKANIEEAFRYCEAMTRMHYENFPVASLLIPKAKRPFICSVYAFARCADDFADEGDRTPEERLHLLGEWQNKLDACVKGKAEDPVFIALGETIRTFGLSPQLFSDLLTAFRMDVTTNRYATFEDVLYYCKHSANPVGRLVLHIFGEANEHTLPLSDLLCTALQLTNFWQDVSVDLGRGRLYLPLEDIGRFGYTEAEGMARMDTPAFRRVVAFEVQRTRELFGMASALPNLVGAGLRFELRLTWRGGMTILDKIEDQGFDVMTHRVSLSPLNKLFLLIKALRANSS